MDKVISVVGLGYVGLPLAVALSRHLSVIGYDHNATRIKQLKSGVDITNEIENINQLKSSKLFLTSSSYFLKKANFHIIAVPTPINHAKQPDLSALLNATKTLAHRLKKGDIVVYESTVYPGATEEDCVPLLEKISKLKCGQDFNIGYSPERINPGDRSHTLENIKKIISAQNHDTLRAIEKVYHKIILAGLYKAPNIRVAEAAKIIENVQRDLNVALLNEVALIFNRMNIDTQEVLKAASTKWNFLPFSPGLVGGHCIGVDPYYLTYQAQSYGYHPEVMSADRRVNDTIAKHIAEQTIRLLIKKSITTKKSKILILGIGFKENCPDIRNSRVLDLYRELCAFGIKVFIHDPYANPADVKKQFNIKLINLNKLPLVDALILAVAHNDYKNLSMEAYRQLLKPNAVIADVKSILDPEQFRKNGYVVWRL